MIDPVEANDALGSASCAFSGCPALVRLATPTRVERIADATLDLARLAARPIEWMLLGAVLYVVLTG